MVACSNVAGCATQLASASCLHAWMAPQCDSLELSFHLIDMPQLEKGW